MKSLTRYLIIFMLMLIMNQLSFAAVTLSAIFSDNMVLQQKTMVSIWGRGSANTQVTLVTSWNNKKYIFRTDASGAWRVKVSTPVAGGPYQISISDGKPIVLKNILIGEVWFCSGQSNMEMPMRGFKNQPVDKANEMLLEADNDELRLFDVRRAALKIPVDSISGQWKSANAESVRDFSAVAYMYGMQLHQKLKVPVGIIVSCWGGTRVQSWMDYEMLDSFKDAQKEYIDKSDTSRELHKLPCSLFNGMIAPCAGFGIKGFLWYQGESNRHEPKKYETLFPAMVKGWRARWMDSKDSLPFYYVQIAPYGIKDTTRSVRGLREAQLKALSVIPNAGMAVTMDIGDSIFIHPREKKKVSDRLLLWALSKTYGLKGLSFSGPLYKSMTIQDSVIIVSFDHAEHGLSLYGQEFRNLEIAGADKVFYPAKGKFNEQGKLIVWCDQVKSPVAVRYGWKDYCKGELYNTFGLPASSFRTDDW